MSEWTTDFRKKTLKNFAWEMKRAHELPTSIARCLEVVSAAIGYTTYASMCAGGKPIHTTFDMGEVRKRAENLGIPPLDIARIASYIQNNLPAYIAECEGMHGGQGA